MTVYHVVIVITVKLWFYVINRTYKMKYSIVEFPVTSIAVNPNFKPVGILFCSLVYKQFINSLTYKNEMITSKFPFYDESFVMLTC